MTDFMSIKDCYKEKLNDLFYRSKVDNLKKKY